MSTGKQTNLNRSARENFRLPVKNIKSLNRAIGLQTAVEKSIKIIQDVMCCEAGSLMLLDEETGELVVNLPSGSVRNKIRGKRISKGAGIGGWVLAHEKPYYSNNPRDDEHFSRDISDNFTTQNIICVPLFDDTGQAFGVLQAINRNDSRLFEDGDIPVLEALASHVSIAVERSREVESLQQKLDEKEVMLTEVHHRVKNNLSTLTALIEMEISEVDDEAARQVLGKTSSRINSMTEVHNLLHSSGLENNVDLGSYLQRLTDNILSVLSNGLQDVDVGVSIKTDAIFIDADRVMSCGLLLNELLQNSYKHAFKNKDEGEILITLIAEDDNDILLKVSDNGDGIADDFSLNGENSTGSWLITALLERLEATVDITRNGGTGFAVHFEK